MRQDPIDSDVPSDSSTVGSTDASASGGERGRNLLQVVPEQLGLRLWTPKGVAVHSIRPPGSMTFRSPGDFVAIMLAPSPRLEGRLGSDKTQIVDARAGMLSINPANVESTSRWSSPKDNLAIGYEPGSLADLAAREIDLLDLRLEPPPAGHVDAQALQIALLIKQELVEGASNELYIDSLMTVLGLHVLRVYSNAADKPESARAGGGGLSDAGASRVRAFLREHFSTSVSVKMLAALCGLSPSRFIHAFTRTFGEPPHRHLMNLRLDRAEQLLSDTKLTIAEIAYLSGFSSQSHLTSAMSKHRRTTPARLRADRSS